MTKILFNVAAIKTCTNAEGPFLRLAVWFQGCLLKCRDCCNPDFLPMMPRHFMTLDDIMKVIVDSKISYGIEGVTFLGGEPTLQKGLPTLAKAISSEGLGIILFTGRFFEELDDDLVKYVDLVVDGRFICDSKDEFRNMIGSSNQRLIDLSGRYKNALDWFSEKRENHVEIEISGEYAFFNGDCI